MKTWKQSFVALLLTAVSSGLVGANAADTGATTPADDAQKALIADYITAVNAKDLARLKAVMHPKCRAAISDADHDFWDRVFTGEFNEVIPVDTKLNITPVRPDQLEGMKGFATFPVMPTYQIQINWFPTTNNLRARMFFAVKDGDKWYEVVPIPTPETLQRFRLQQAAPQKNGSGSGVVTK